MTKLLAGVYWRQFRRSFSSLRFGQVAPLIAIVVIGLMFLPILFFGVSTLGGFLPEEARTSLFSIAVIAAIIVTVLFAIPNVFKHLFSSRDVELLFTLPIGTKHIYWIKYAQSFFSTALFVWLFLLLFFIAFGAGAIVHWLYYIVIPFVSLTVVFIGLSIAYLFNLLLIQVLPRSRAKELMTVMTGMAGFFIFLLFQLPNLMGWERFSDGIGTELPASPTFLPNYWAGESLRLFGQGFSWEALGLVSGLFIFTVILTVLTTTFVERGFRTGWIRLSENSSKKRKKRNHTSKSTKLLKHPVIFLGLKELRTVQRDPREWMTFLPLIFMMIIPIFPLAGNQEALEEITNNPLISWLVAHGMLIFFFTMLIGNFSASSIGREEKAVWILRTLPLSGMQIALGKLWPHWLIPFVFVIILEVAMGLFLGWQWYMTVAGIATFGFISLGMSSIGLWAGTIGGKYNPNNPQQRIETGTGFLLMLINIPYMLLMFFVAILLFLPTEYAPFIRDFSEGTVGIFAILGSLVAAMLKWKIVLGKWSLMFGIIALIVLVLAVTFLFVRLSAKRIDQGIQITIVDSASGNGRKFKGLR